MSHNQDDSISLVIQNNPKQQQPKITKNIVRDVQMISNTQSNRLDIYFTVNKIYLNNLITRRQKPSIKPQLKNSLGKQCIIYKEFKLTQKNIHELFANSSQIPQQIRGNIRIMHYSQVNLEIKLYFVQKIIQVEDNIWLNLNYNSLGIWRTKSLELFQSQNIYTWKIPINDLQQYNQNNLLINIALRKPQKSTEKQFLGIRNLGNTCYLNSCLQMMFFIRPLRKAIVEFKTKNKLMNEVKEAFVRLMDIQQKSAIDIQSLLESYDRFNELPRRQQDVQEFLLDFINQLENENCGFKNLWEGHCLETTFSKQNDKPYISTKKQSFCQLDVYMFDHDGEYFKKIQESLQFLLKEEEVDEMIQNDDHGKIKVNRVKRFDNLPDVLFINLKRYEFNKEKMRSVKIGNHIEYQQNLNLDFLLAKDETPGRVRGSRGHPNFDYSLMSVIVHKGTSPQNGHYFAFINTSSNPQKPQWFKFNDSIVRKSSSQEVLQFTGKKKKDVVLDRQQGRFSQKQIESDESCYLLVYMRKKVFNEYQSIEVKIPQSYLKDKIKRKADEQKKNMVDINAYVLPTQQAQIDIFSDQIEETSVPLNQDKCLIPQLRKIDEAFLGCKIFKAYKVNKSQRKIKSIDDDDLVKQIKTTRRGHFTFDYVLIIPQSNQADIFTKFQKMEIQQAESDKTVQLYDDNWCVLHILRNQLSDEIDLLSFIHISAEQIAILEGKVQQKGGDINYLNDKKAFDQKWSSFLQIQIVKVQ